MPERSPLTLAIWHAHHAMSKRENGAPAPEVVEEIAKTAITTFLNALAGENKVQTGHTPGYEGGDAWIHRPIYSPDLKRLAEQTEKSPTIGIPGGDFSFEYDEWSW